MNSKSSKNMRCPRCRKVAPWEENKWRPFCSERCKTLDLGAWASEDYKIPDETDEYDEEFDGSGDIKGGLN